jgi:hypothetical protein
MVESLGIHTHHAELLAEWSKLFHFYAFCAEKNPHVIWQPFCLPLFRAEPIGVRGQTPLSNTIKKYQTSHCTPS